MWRCGKYHWSDVTHERHDRGFIEIIQVWMCINTFPLSMLVYYNAHKHVFDNWVESSHGDPCTRTSSNGSHDFVIQHTRACVSCCPSRSARTSDIASLPVCSLRRWELRLASIPTSRPRGRCQWNGCLFSQVNHIIIILIIWFVALWIWLNCRFTIVQYVTAIATSPCWVCMLIFYNVRLLPSHLNKRPWSAILLNN